MPVKGTKNRAVPFRWHTLETQELEMFPHVARLAPEQLFAEINVVISPFGSRLSCRSAEDVQSFAKSRIIAATTRRSSRKRTRSACCSAGSGKRRM